MASKAQATLAPQPRMCFYPCKSPPHLTRAVAGGAQAERRGCQRHRDVLEKVETASKKARKEHKFKAVQKDEMAESMSLFLGGVPANLTRAEPSKVMLITQGWCVFEGNRDCIDEQFTKCIFIAFVKVPSKSCEPMGKNYSKYSDAVRSWLLPLQRTPLQSHECFFRDRFHCSAKKHQTGKFWGKVKETFALLCKPLLPQEGCSGPG